MFYENRNHIERVAQIKLSTLIYHSGVVKVWSILALIGILVRRKVGRRSMISSSVIDTIMILLTFEVDL